MIAAKQVNIVSALLGRPAVAAVVFAPPVMTLSELLCAMMENEEAEGRKLTPDELVRRYGNAWRGPMEELCALELVEAWYAGSHFYYRVVGD